IIYGENGAGKSNLVESFHFLKDTMDTFRIRNHLEEMREVADKEKSVEQLLFLEQQSHYKIFNYNLEKLINDIRCIGTNEDIEIEYGFNIDGIDGFYRMVFDNKIKEEELFYQLSR